MHHNFFYLFTGWGSGFRAATLPKALDTLQFPKVRRERKSSPRVDEPWRFFLERGTGKGNGKWKLLYCNRVYIGVTVANRGRYHGGMGAM